MASKLVTCDREDRRPNLSESGMMGGRLVCSLHIAMGPRGRDFTLQGQAAQQATWMHSKDIASHLCEFKSMMKEG